MPSILMELYLQLLCSLRINHYKSNCPKTVHLEVRIILITYRIQLKGAIALVALTVNFFAF